MICGFNGPAPVVYCGSFNLALVGEQQNGDNLLEIHDPDVVTAFVIEALALVDHFQSTTASRRGRTRTARLRTRAPEPSRTRAGEDAGWFLSTSDRWAAKYFDPRDLHHVDRRLFGV